VYDPPVRALRLSDVIGIDVMIGMAEVVMVGPRARTGSPRGSIRVVATGIGVVEPLRAVEIVDRAQLPVDNARSWVVATAGLAAIRGNRKLMLGSPKRPPIVEVGMESRRSRRPMRTVVGTTGRGLTWRPWICRRRHELLRTFSRVSWIGWGLRPVWLAE
tara:strand:+ start:371 stop:850 length:480 start_codon:yes stop_codon:yes gene_type:complete